MKRILCFVFVIAVFNLSENHLMAQSLPDGFEWVYGCWENPRTGDSYIIGNQVLQEPVENGVSASTIKRKTPHGIHESTYSVSEEGYLITDLDVFVFEDGVLHRHYSNTKSYIISTYIRPAGTVIPLADLLRD